MRTALKPKRQVADHKNGGCRKGSPHVSESGKQLRQKQRDAIWKWRWLGFRESTPGFKGSLVLLVVAVVLIVLYATGVL